MTTDSTGAFHARARFEASRYGADAWVFVRELLQNSRDAGAGRVLFETSSVDGLDRIVCRDDGSGMTFSHARQYLFTLYASSKRGGRRNAGRFGIGFWSILRFAPTAVTICSQVRNRSGWHIRFDADLRVVERLSFEMKPGTEIVIERPAGGDDIEDLLRKAVLRDAPFVTHRDDPDRPIDVRINGNRVRAPFDLPPPSLRFRRRGLRGVVALGREPGVEVFAHGLRVRDSASLDDLLLTGRRVRPAFSAARDGLAPRALMDSSRLTVLLARGDAREDRSLRRLVAVGHHEIRRLVRAELDRHTRPSRAALAMERTREAWLAHPLLIAGAAILGVVAAFAGWMSSTRSPLEPIDHAAITSVESGAPSIPAEPPRPYADLGSFYRGPQADALGPFSPAVDLEYLPADDNPHFAALLIAGIDAAGTPLYPPPSDAVHWSGEPCAEGCLDVEIAVAPGSGLLRLPVATGHAVDTDSVRWNGEPLALTEAGGGLPTVDLGGNRGGRLSYRSGPAEAGPTPVGGEWPPLPPEMSDVCDQIEQLAPDARADAAADWVHRRVAYDASEATARRHRFEQRRGRGLFERSLDVGAGDCDVQNALVAAILDAVGVPSRLAVGWVGEAGRARPGLHAWVQYLGSDGRWRVVDASVAAGSAPPGSAVPSKAGRSRTHSGRLLRRSVMASLSAAVLVGWILWLRRNNARRSFSLGGRDGIADLVRAAAVHPESFAGIHALYHRKLVPLLGGRFISMARALDAAGRGRLAVGGRESALAVSASDHGVVIDGDLAAGAAAAEALGAVDLDFWHELLSRSWDDPVATRVGEVLTAAGEPCSLQIARDVGEDMAVLDGARVGHLAGETRLVLDAGSEFWETAHGLGSHSPAAAALFLALLVVDRLGLPQPAKDRCLAELGRAALNERVGGQS